MWVSATGEQDNSLITSAMDRLAQHELTAAIATASDGQPWIFTAYVAMRDNKFWFTSQDATRHAAEIRQSGRVAVALWTVPERWGAQLVGVQIEGAATEVVDTDEADIGLDAMHAKFPGTLETLPDHSAVVGETRKTCMFVIEGERGSLRDEGQMGKGRFPIVWSA